MDWDPESTKSLYNKDESRVSLYSKDSMYSRDTLYATDEPTQSLYSKDNKDGVRYSYHSVSPGSNPETPDVAVEKPKVPLRRFFNPFKHLIHIIALAASGGVLQLSFRNQYWSDEANWGRKWFLLGLGQVDTLNVLQFASKIHEILVVASLSSIFIHIARRKLIGRDGIPFGLLIGTYQIGSAEYLFSGSFGHPFLRSLRDRNWTNFFLAFGLGLSIVYANMVGPASAIAMIPNLDWWPLTAPYGNRTLESFIGLSFDMSYPTTVSLQKLFDDDKTRQEYVDACNITNPSMQCPGGGHDDLNHWSHAWSQEGITYDLQMTNLAVRARRELAFRVARANPTDAGVSFATTLKSSAVMLTDLFWQYISTNNVGPVTSVGRPQLSSSDNAPLYAPLVQVQCNTIDYFDAREKGIAFPSNLLSNFSVPESNAYAGGRWAVPRNLYDFDLETRLINFTWADVSALKSIDGSMVHASIASVLTLPTLNITKLANGSSIYQQRAAFVPCMIDARWAAAEITYDPKNGPVVKHNLTDLNVFLDPSTRTSEARARLGLTETISIDPTWADLLNPKTPGFRDNKWGAEDYQNMSAIEILFYQFVVPTEVGNSSYFRFNPPLDGPEDGYYANVSSITSSILGMVVADGLARVTHGSSLMELEPEQNGEVTLVNLQFLAGGEKKDPFPISTKEIERFLAVKFQIQRWGWGYGLKSQTVMFAVVVLTLHAALCLYYFGAAFVFWVQKRGYTSKAWADLGELVALALLSREPAEFRNAGAGIKKSKTWNNRINIRERGTSSIEMVVNYRGGRLAPNEDQVCVGKKYAS